MRIRHLTRLVYVSTMRGHRALILAPNLNPPPHSLANLAVQRLGIAIAVKILNFHESINLELR
jgi:hypothetical protein